jgi:hypothetical protein
MKKTMAIITGTDANCAFYQANNPYYSNGIIVKLTGDQRKNGTYQAECITGNLNTPCIFQSVYVHIIG